MFDNCSEIDKRFEIKANSFNSSASAVKSKCYPDMFRNNRGVNYKSDTPLNENFWQYGLSCGSNMNYAAAFSNSMTKSIEGLAGLTPLQRQQLLSAAAFQQRQKHLAQAMLARQQLALATALASTSYNGNFSTFPTSHQQQQQQQQPQQEPEDEISKSLKIFAMLTAHKNGSYGSFDNNNKISTQAPRLSPVDVVMQDFANNGYVSDDLNRHHPMNLNHNNNDYSNNNNNNNNNRIIQWTTDNMTSVGSNNQNISNDPAAAIPLSIYNQRQLALQQQQQIALQKQLNVHFNNNNIWKTTPSTATTGSAISPPINMFDLNNNNNKKKLPKRFSVVKSDKYMAVKHCVFCENNNEPEAVVMSHAVRDALGRVLCPKLRTYICPICQASGDEAHTVKYCPKKPIITMDDTLRLANTGVYKQQMQV